MPATVRAVDASSLSERELRAIYEVMAACHAEASPEEPYRPFADTAAYLRHPPASEPRLHWLAERDGDCAGFARLGLLPGSPAADVEVLVRPDARRAGVGGALFAAVRERARAEGCRALLGSHATPAGAAFAASVGAADTRVDVRSLLHLPRPHPGAPLAAGYVLRSWVGAAPDELLDSYARAREAINDAPRADELEWSAWDPARVRDLEAAVERRGRDARVTVACDRDGLAVGFTELRVSRTPGAVAGTEDTAVLAAHRQRGLARAVKVESLRLLQRDRPDVRLVATTNAAENHAMLALNRALGFAEVARYTACVVEP